MHLCFIGNSHVGQFNLDKYNGNHNINNIYSLGASIKGLNNPLSKCNLDKK